MNPSMTENRISFLINDQCLWDEDMLRFIESTLFSSKYQIQEVIVLKLTEFVGQVQNFRKRNSLKFVFSHLIEAAVRQQAIDLIRLLKANFI